MNLAGAGFKKVRGELKNGQNADSSGRDRIRTVPGAGANTVSAFTLPTISVRNATDAEMVKWNAAFRNLIAYLGLGQLVKDGKPPQRDAVKKEVARTWMLKAPFFPGSPVIWRNRFSPGRWAIRRFRPI